MVNRKTQSPTYPRDRVQEREFFNNLHLEEKEAIEMLQVASCSGDPDLQAKAMAKLRRIAMDYFAAKYLHYAGSVRGITAYHIDYSYHREYQEGKDFSPFSQVKWIDELPPIQVSGING